METDREAELDALRDAVVLEIMGRTPGNIDIRPGEEIRMDYLPIEREPDYPRDFAAAWRVVERMDIAIYQFTLSSRIMPNGKTTWEAVFTEGRSPFTGRYFAAYADTAPDAICQAAIKVARDVP